MTRFIWVRDREKVDHYINIDSINRVCKVPASGTREEYGYLILTNNKEIPLSNDKYDTADDVIAKIQVASV